MKKIAFVLIAMLIVATGAFAQKATKPGGGSITIGYTFFAATDVFQNNLKNAFVEAAKAKGIEVKVIDPQLDIGKQLEAIDTFISLKVDAIVCSPLDPQGAVPGVIAANKAGIPYIAINSMLGEGGKATYVGSLNLDAGKIEGAYLAKVLKKDAKVVYLRGAEGMTHTVDRRVGVQQSLFDVRKDVKLLAEQTANYDRTQAMKVMEDWLQAFPQIDGVIAANDQMALGALEAMKAAKRDKGVAFGGIDGTTEAKQDVANGSFAITVLQDAKGQAAGALQAAIDLINKKTLPPQIIIPFTGITKDNIKQFM